MELSKIDTKALVKKAKRLLKYVKLPNSYDACAVCGKKYGEHRWGDDACPTFSNKKKFLPY